jgi:signal transduction histidine kinase/CheY-like chemotaxis protein
MNVSQLSKDLMSRVVAHLPSRFQPGRMPYAFFFVALMIAVLLGYSVYPALPPFRWVYLTMVVFLVALLTAYQKGLPLPWAVNLGTSIGLLLLMAVGWFTGGIFSLNIAWLMILPLTPLYMIGWRAGLAWYLVVMLVICGLGLASHMQWLPEYHLQRSKDGQAYTTFSILTMVMIVVPMIYDRMYVNALRIIRAYQQELEAKRLELEHTLDMREHFIGIVSHELRTPMNAIVGFNALLLSRVQDRPEAIKALQHTGRAADHLMTVINDILDYSQLQAGQLMVQRETFVLRDVALHAFELFLPRVRGMALDYRIEQDEALPTWVSTDRHRLMQVLVNLLGNALKFTHQGSVVLRVQWENPGVLFSVQDTGIGIPLEQQDRIFRRYAQADANIQARYGGNGLGLAISRQLVELLGGEMGFESAPGQGSRFWFRLSLPACEAPQRASQAEHAPAPMQTAPVAWRFLVVDDHPINRLLVKQVLKNAWPKAQVLEAVNGQQALEVLAQSSVDLVLMDMVMPVMDGIEATRRLRQNTVWQPLPVMGLTANVNPVDLETFRQAGLNTVMLKPFEPVQLCSRIEQLLLKRL